MYPMEKGVLISDPNRGVRIGDSLITRKQIKHIVEQRKAEGKSIEEIKEIILDIPAAIMDFDFEVPNRNERYPGSLIRYKVFSGLERGIAVVVDKKVRRMRTVITAYLCSPAKIYKIKKKLDTSAAGETPHS
jgi:hypothetical protein